MSSDFWQLKVHAFLHDPPEKAIMLMRDEGHESRARNLVATLIGEAPTPDIVRKADHIAAACDRIVLVPSRERAKEFGSVKVRFNDRPVLINPLSGTEYNLADESGPLEAWNFENDDAILKEARQAVNQIVDDLRSSYSQESRTLYFALWRLLPQMLAATAPINEQARLGHLWHLLPADTRMPDHSIWDHLSMTAAIASALPRPAFLLFTVGPVQSFISTARRTQDLWMGSYLLSSLMWRAARVVMEELGPDAVVYPSLYSQPLVDQWLSESNGLNIKPESRQLAVASFPNRFLALVPEERAAQLANQARQEMVESWQDIWRGVKSEVEQQVAISGDSEWNRIWKRQARDVFETYWVAFPWLPSSDSPDPESDKSAKAISTYHAELLPRVQQPSTPGHPLQQDFGTVLDKFCELNPAYVNIGTAYQALYELTDHALAARKGLRNFCQLEEVGYKCSLCGEREALHPQMEQENSRSRERRLRHFWGAVADRFPGHFKKDGAERLCAVCTTKRLAAVTAFGRMMGIDERFPSTSSIAAAPFQVRLLQAILKGNQRLVEAFEHYVATIGNLKDTTGIRWQVSSVPLAWSLRGRFNGRLRGDVEEFLHTDGDWLFEESFDPELIRQEYRPDLGTSEAQYATLAQQVADARAALSRLLRVAGESPDQVGKPSRYYAVLYCDGDDMGKWLSGENAPAIVEVAHPDIRSHIEKAFGDVSRMRRLLAPFLHNSISAALRDFSCHLVQRIIEERHTGKLVYAGGDDILALLPKEEVIPAAIELRLLYSGLPVEKFIGPDFLKSHSGFVRLTETSELFRVMGEKATLSTGVSLVHHSHSLTDAIEKARAMMKMAKALVCENGERKNALFVSSTRRSGEAQIVGTPWFANGDVSASPVFTVMEFARAFGAEHVSPRFVHALHQEQDGLKAVGRQSAESRLHYLLHRHIDVSRMPGVKPEDKQQAAHALEDRLLKHLLSSLCILQQVSSQGENACDRSHELERLLQLLQVAVFLAREERQ